MKSQKESLLLIIVVQVTLFFELKVVLNLTSKLNTNVSQGRLTWTGEIAVPSINTQIASTEKYTIFSKSGISIIDGSNNYFHINNSDKVNGNKN